MAKHPSEIAAVLKRQGGSSGPYEIGTLQHRWETGGQAAKPFQDFFPIRLVTIFETSIRDIAKQAVNHGPPYAQRGMELVARWPSKTILDALHAINQKDLTLGDFVSHGLPTGRMDEVLSTLGIIFGKTFREDLANSRTRWIEDEEEGIEAPLLITNLSETIGCLDRLLQVRHILVHERPRECPYQADDLPTFFDHAGQFLGGLDWLLVNRLHGAVPRTQAGMNVAAGERAAIAQAELDELRGGTRDRFQEPKSPVEEIEFHWDRFCELSADRQAGYFSSELTGSMAPLIWSSKMEKLLQWRIGQIKADRDREEGDL